MSKQNKVLLSIFLILLVVLLISAALIAKLFFGYDFTNLSAVNNDVKEDDEIVRSPLHESDGNPGTGRDVEYFIDDSGTYIPDYENVDENEYDPALFYVEDGKTYYNSDKARYGIDVSSHQKDVDWEAVAADGIDYAILRAAYRGYGQGTLSEDDYFRQNAEAALSAGLEIGAYVFSQAITVEEAVEEAEFMLELVKDYKMEYPIVFDWEPITNDTARTDNVTNEELTDFAVAFCETIEAAGYDAAVYLNTSQGYMEYDLERIYEYEIWLADYDDIPDYYYDFNMWQYTNQGEIDGVTGPVDLNISFKNYAA